MKAAASRFIPAILAISAFLFLAGCGGGGGGGGGSDSSGQTLDANAPYGSLALSGTGTDVAGTTFAARTRTGSTTMSGWYSIDLTAGTTYPFVVLILYLDGANNVQFVDFNYMISESAAAGEWVTFSAPVGTVSVSSTDVTFANLELTGYGYTTTTLTLNGTLTF